jgi:hypothetical protein
MVDGTTELSVPNLGIHSVIRDTTVTVRMKNVLTTELMLIPIGTGNPMPRLHLTVRDHVLPLHPEMVQNQDHDFMMDKIGWREMLSYDEDIINIDDEGGSDDSDGEGEDSDDEGDDTNEE